MNLNEFVQVGTVFKAHGTRGWLKIYFNHPLLVSEDLSFLFVGKLPKPLPYPILELRAIDQDQYLIQLEGIDSKEAADKLAKKELWLPEDKASEYFDMDEGNHSLEGFLLIDQEENEIGTIDEIVEMPMQMLAQVHYNEKDVLIPLNEQTILGIDQDEQVIQVSIAEGLLDL